MSYVDLHLHLLAGVDDGPGDETESLAYAERLVREGVHEATVTPHVAHPWFPVDVGSIPARTAALQSALDRAGLGLRLHAGGELHPAGAAGLSSGELDVVAHGPAGARWVLLEAPFAGIDAAFLATCRAIREQGLGPVIAHPERAAGLMEGGLELMRGELVAGAVLQVNVCSLLGHNGAEAQAAAARLIRTGRAYLLASDGHGRPGRAHTLRIGFDLALAAGASSVHAWRLTQANPRFLLRHGLPALLPAPARRNSAGDGERGSKLCLVRAAREAAARLPERQRPGV